MAKSPKNTSRTERLKQRNINIRARYQKLSTAPTWYRDSKIMEILTSEYLELTEETLNLIISKTGHYKNL